MSHKVRRQNPLFIPPSAIPADTDPGVSLFRYEVREAKWGVSLNRNEGSE